MPNIRRIYDVDYYSVKKNTVNYCIQCGKKILINTSAYAKDSKNSSQLVCRECIMILADQFQYEKYGRIPFPKEEPLYVGLVGHTCSTLNHSDFVTKTAIFRRKKRSAIISVSHCIKCNRFFVEQQDFQKHHDILYDYKLHHTITGKILPGSRADTAFVRVQKPEEPDIPASVLWAYMHPYQGGGCSGK